MKISDLYNEVLVYLLSIKPKNLDAAYTPTGTLANGGTLSTNTWYIHYSPDYTSSSAYRKVTLTVSTNETIPAKYTKATTTAAITSDWNNFKNTYMDKMLNANSTITLTSVFIFIYLVRCFVDSKFCLFTDTYNKSKVWLYNTENVAGMYNIDTNITTTELTKDSVAYDKLEDIILLLAEQVSKRNSIYILKSTTSNTITSATASEASSWSSSTGNTWNVPMH
jgi:hypothetical protein